ncbi:DUF7144 family membrane protein [Streptomyces galbus]|uniref:DUF7144 domain-containing protein n=1 Tax=Streptomyces galbus TaxID=33898 RepID=A0A4U5X612_STRGB|nr:hypothetical protein [Streptomyces galbus]TKT08886.1 hypothetical protein E4U92_14845 [Streptomyces galbus]GHD25191.1 hypothetical protein GCM10010335_10120 [Streptomyces galbus]
MSQAAQPDRPDGPAPPRTAGRSAGRVGGGVVFAAVLMVCGGVLAVLQGISAVAADDVYARVGAYVYALDLTGWGVVHIVVGALVAATGYALLMDQAWARLAGVFLASLSLIAQFLFLPYAPVWSVVMMAIDVFVIWALAGRQEAVA